MPTEEELKFSYFLKRAHYDVISEQNVRISNSLGRFSVYFHLLIGKEMTVVHVYDSSTISLGSQRNFRTLVEAYQFTIEQGINVKLTDVQRKEIAEFEERRKQEMNS